MVTTSYFQDAHWTEQYVWSIWRSLSHMITIGYGRDPPQEVVEVTKNPVFFAQNQSFEIMNIESHYDDLVDHFAFL